MNCSQCGKEAVFVDERPGANTVGFCRAHLPETLRPIQDRLVPRRPSRPAGKLKPTPAGNPVPVRPQRLGAEPVGAQRMDPDPAPKSSRKQS